MSRGLYAGLVTAWSLLGSLYAADAPAKPSAPPVSGSQPCMQLTQEEQQFAGRLSRLEDQRSFCQSMTAAQRQQVMAMTRPTPGSTSAPLSPDQAMQKYQAQTAPQKGSAPATPQAPPAAKSGAAKPATSGTCPIQ